MNQVINMEVKFFLVSIAWGVILLVIYDCLRIFRKVIKHGIIMISIEDILYWITSAVLIFRMMYDLNDGIIRGFSLLGILLGMILYKYSISEHVVKGISFVLLKIKGVLVKMFQLLLKPLKFFCRKVRQFLLFIQKKLQKRLGTMAHFVKNKVSKLQIKQRRVRMDKRGDDQQGNRITTKDPKRKIKKAKKKKVRSKKQMVEE